VVDLIDAYELGPSTRAIVEAAERRGIPCTRLGDDTLVQLGYGKHRKFIHAAMSSDTSAIAVDTAGNKALTKAQLTRAGVPTPGGRVVQSEDAAVLAFEELGAPLVVKPLDGNQGKGVSLDLCTLEQVRYVHEPF
jgi:cyanophycin synthetase